MGIRELAVTLAADPKSARSNFDLAQEYERLSQHTSAAGFYLRAAELGYKSDSLLTYTSLLKMALCWANQNDRKSTVVNTLHHAIAFLPNRPEAYFLLARHYEHNREWQKAFTFAELGLQFALNTYNLPLPAYVDYPGVYCLLFERAVAGWWLGRKEESKQMFNHLLDNFDMAPEYINGCLNNLKVC